MPRFVLGGGVAGLTYALFDKEAVVIDANPLGQLASPYVLGPRIIEQNTLIEYALCDYICPMLNIPEPTTVTEKIGYYNGEEILDEADHEFKKAYSKITRGKEKYESSFLSSGKNIITHYVSKNKDKGDDLYKNIFVAAVELLRRENRLIEGRVEELDIIHKQIKIREGPSTAYRLAYDKVVSTLNQNIFKNIVKMTYKGEYQDYLDFKNIDLLVKGKNFLVLPSDANHVDGEYAYIYSIDGKFTRKTFFKDYTVFENESTFDMDYFLVEPLKVYENVPIQIVNSTDRLCDLNSDIMFLGRYAQWNHKIKFEQILEELAIGHAYV